MSKHSEGAGLKGFVTLELHDADGNLKERHFRRNLITDTGDLYNAAQVITGVAPGNAAAPTLVQQMQLGTGTTAAAKNGAGAAVVTYISGSNQAFDATYPQTSNLGAGLGVQAVYKVTYAAGTATNSAITEAVVVDTSANSAATAGHTYSRVTFSAINKTATDVLTVTWNWKYLGA